MNNDGESSRLQFLTVRDGIEGALEFAKRTLVSYRRAVIQKNIAREYRRNYIESYLSFKEFIREHKNVDHS